MRDRKRLTERLRERIWTALWRMSIRLHKKNHRVILLILVACYFLTGMESSSSNSTIFGRGNAGSHSASQNSGTKDNTDNRPYWTNHKHEPEKLRFVSSPVALLFGIPLGRTGRSFLTPASASPSALAEFHADSQPGRAPPLHTD